MPRSNSAPRFILASAVSAIIIAAADARAQQPIPIRRLAAPTARSQEPVADIIELKQLPDGRVLAHLPFQARLIVFDSSLSASKPLIDTSGHAAARYSSRAMSLIPFIGDSMLFGDVAAQSFTIITPNGELARAVASPTGRDFGAMSLWQPGGKTGTDARGRIVYQVSGARPRAQPDGSLPSDTLPSPLYAAIVLRADFAARTVDTIARVISLGARRYTNAGTKDAATLINPLLPAIDDWAALADGSIAIVRGHDYHIDWVRPDGTTISTPPMPFDWRRVTDDEKRAKLDSARRLIDSLKAANADPYQMVVSSAVRRDTIHPRLDYVTPEQMSDYVPPIRWGTIRPDADGHLWILPATSSQAKGGLLYDVVNQKGEVFQRVQLPAGRAIAGFGRGGVVYMIAKAEDGQWYLERTSVIP